MIYRLYELRLPTAIDPDVLPDNGDDMPITAQDSLENLRDEIGEPDSDQYLSSRTG